MRIHTVGVIGALLLLLSACAADRDVTQGPPDSESAARIANAMLRAGNPDAAIHVADGMLVRDTRNPAAHALRGRALLALGRYGQAAEELVEATRTGADDTPTLSSLAAARFASGDASSAEIAWRAALAHNPSDRAANIGLAIALDVQGRHANAQMLYRKALEADPDDLAAATDLGLSLALSGHAQESVAILERPNIQAQGSRARHDLAVALVLAGNEPQASTLLQQDLTAEETNIVVQRLRALAQAPGTMSERDSPG